MNVDEFAGDMETLCGRGARILEVQGLQGSIVREVCVLGVWEGPCGVQGGWI